MQKKLITAIMKRIDEEVPELNDIIFRDRNKEYGAYQLRKGYKTVAGFSILSAVIICTSLVISASISTEQVTGSDGKDLIVIIQPEAYKPQVIKVPEVKPPVELIKQIRNVAPQVVDSVEDNTFIPITDVITATTVNGDVNDTVTYTEIPDDVIPVEPTVFISVEEMPEFPGGESALLTYIGRNTVYPVEAIENNIEGRVFLKFVVKPDGTVGNIEILRSVDPLLDQEAERVVGTLPKFNPGKHNGVPVNVWYSVPVLFRITR
jgi:protein TonB